MRQSRTAQTSIFESYAEHDIGVQLSKLSDVLDQHDEVLRLVEHDLLDKRCANTGRRGLTVESVFRCLILKQRFQISYDQLAFVLCDSQSYRTFARLDHGQMPKKSSLQSTIRRIRPNTLEQIHKTLMSQWIEGGELSCKEMRVDSTVVKSNIAPPSDSRLLDDSIRVISRLLSKSRDVTGVKIFFTDKRKPSKSLSFRIFNAKNAEKEVLYPDHLKMMRVVTRQVDRAFLQVSLEAKMSDEVASWLNDLEHYKRMAFKVIDQTERRVIGGERVPAIEKIVSIFEEHTDIIVKGFRDIQYGHKINLSSVANGFITYLSIEDGNPSDKSLFLPVLDAHHKDYGLRPQSIVCDGGYASQHNVFSGRECGVKRVVFNKRVGLTYRQMGVQEKTFRRLKDFRAGVEGNISELKRVFGAAKAMWKKRDGFNAFVWSAVICYNLTHMARQQLE